MSSRDICRREKTQVYSGLIRSDGREAAVKRVIKLLYEKVDNEVKSLVKVHDHPNIVDYMVFKLHLYYKVMCDCLFVCSLIYRQFHIYEADILCGLEDN